MKQLGIRIGNMVATVLVVAAASIAQANDNGPKSLRVFGDSLVDSGNLPSLTYLIELNGKLVPGPGIPAATRYDRGRFSNGRVFPEYVASRLGTYLVPASTFNGEGHPNFAIGGASTGEIALNPGGLPVTGILGQVAQYLNGQYPIDPDAIHIILGGSNDYIAGRLYALGILQQPPGTPPFLIPSADPLVVIDNLEEAIRQLHDSAGANVFVVPNLPDLGKIPFCADFTPLALCDFLSKRTRQHNFLLNRLLNELELDLPGVTFVRVNFFGLVNRVIENPSKFGFSDVPGAPAEGPASDCLFEQPYDPLNCTRLTSFVSDQIFWDEQHPTWKAHRLLARAVMRRLVASGIIGDNEDDD
jgi:outer membrane lipase/esterase